VTRSRWALRASEVVLLVSATLTGIGLGSVVGFLAGAFLYEALGPPWAQFGYEFEGLREALLGGAIGSIVGGVIAYRTTARFRRAGSERALLAVAAIVGLLVGAALGQAAATEAYQATHPLNITYRELPPECRFKRPPERPHYCEDIELPRVVTLESDRSHPHWIWGGRVVGGAVGAFGAGLAWRWSRGRGRRNGPAASSAPQSPSPAERRR
jgi:hypothetical protein